MNGLRALLVVVAGGLVLIGAAAPAGADERFDGVVLVGVPGLSWSDIDPVSTPVLRRMAEEGTFASLTVRSVRSCSCAVDGGILPFEQAARTAALGDLDALVETVLARAGPETPVVVAGVGDGLSPVRPRAVLVTGPEGLLTSPSTRQRPRPAPGPHGDASRVEWFLGCRAHRSADHRRGRRRVGGATSPNCRASWCGRAPCVR